MITKAIRKNQMVTHYALGLISLGHHTVLMTFLEALTYTYAVPLVKAASASGTDFQDSASRKIS